MRYLSDPDTHRAFSSVSLGQEHGQLGITRTKSWVLRSASSAMICSARPSTLFSTVSISTSSSATCFFRVFVSGSYVRCLMTSSAALRPRAAPRQFQSANETRQRARVAHPSSSASPAFRFRRARSRALRASDASARDMVVVMVTGQGRIQRSMCQ